jgi:hypothetical protein
VGQPVGSRGGVPLDQVATGEARDERIRRRLDQLGRRTGLEQAAGDEDADPVGQRGRVLVVVGDEQRWERERVQELAQLGPDARTRVGVESRERLVEQEDAGIAGQRPGQADALPLAAGERVRPGLGQVRDPGRSRRSPTRSRPP